MASYFPMGCVHEGQDLGQTQEDATALARPPANAAEAFQIAAGSGGTLQHRLDIYSRYSRELFPSTNQAYDELIERLHALKDAGPTPGSKMPDFVLPDQNGTLTSLESVLKSGPLIISLNRGHWCPWCRLELRALASIYDDVLRLNGQLIAIMPETGAYTRKAIEDNKLPFRILTDLDFGYALGLGLVLWVGGTLQAWYSKSGLDFTLFHGNQGWFLPVPATFVISVDGIVEMRFVDPDFRKRIEPQDILAALARLKR